MKKKVLFLFLLSCFVLLPACSKGPELTNEVTTEVNTLEGVSMEIVQHTAHEALVRIVNNNDAAYISDILFSVQVERDGKWYSLKNEFSGSAPAEALLHPGKETSEFMCTWVHMYGVLPEGHYRLVKWLYPHGQGSRGEGGCLAAEFHIGSEQIEQQQWIRDEAPYLTIISDGQSTVPYFHEVKNSSYGQLWTDKLPELEQEIPVVYWSDDFQTAFNRDSSFDSILVYDENCERIYFGEEFVIYSLEPGRYYIDIHLVVQEEYVPEKDRYETSEWSAVFVLEKQGCSEDEVWLRDEAPYVSILSGDETIVPYFHFSFDYEWVAEHQAWLSADGTPLEFDLPELAPGLPTVDYSEGFKPVYNRDSSFYQLFIFDSEYERVYSGNEFSALDDLGAGKYYIGISVTVQGEYIPEGNDRERSGWVGVVALEKQ